MNRILAIILLCIMPFAGYSQKTTKTAKATKSKHKTTKTKKATTAPAWAAAHNYDAKEHAYFPDYYTYYDPQRGGYVYWQNGSWSFSPSVPPYMENVDLTKTRVQILKGLSLDLHPEQNYPHYMELYPRDPNGNTKVPVPVPGNPGQ